MKRHEEKKLHIRCNDCDKECPNTECLHNHIRRVHSDRKMFTCKFCSKHFSTQTTLKNHLISHTGEPNHYNCNFCPRTFTNSGNKVKHMYRMHADDYIEWRKLNNQTKINYV